MRQLIPCLLPGVAAVLGVLGGAAVPRQSSAAEPAVELLKNPGFDEPLDGKGLPRDWSTSADRILWREGVYLSKNYAIASRAGAYVLASQEIRLKPGQRYTIRLTLKGDGGALGGALILHGEERPQREMPLLWNVQPSAEYETYAGTFTAPNPVARLLIYNVARKGMIEYDRVSLREGEPDEPIIGQLSLRESTGRWAKCRNPAHRLGRALAGGPVTACFTLRTFLLLRDTVELARRIDLDYDVIHTGYDGDECVSDTARRAAAAERRPLRGLRCRQPAIEHPGQDDPRAGGSRSRAGHLGGFGQATRFLSADQWKTVDELALSPRAIPWQHMPEKISPRSRRPSARGRPCGWCSPRPPRGSGDCCPAKTRWRPQSRGSLNTGNGGTRCLPGPSSGRRNARAGRAAITENNQGRLAVAADSARKTPSCGSSGGAAGRFVSMGRSCATPQAAALADDGRACRSRTICPPDP